MTSDNNHRKLKRIPYMILFNYIIILILINLVNNNFKICESFETKNNNYTFLGTTINRIKDNDTNATQINTINSIKYAVPEIINLNQTTDIKLHNESNKIDDSLLNKNQTKRSAESLNQFKPNESGIRLQNSSIRTENDNNRKILNNHKKKSKRKYQKNILPIKNVPITNLNRNYSSPFINHSKTYIKNYNNNNNNNNRRIISTTKYPLNQYSISAIASASQSSRNTSKFSSSSFNLPKINFNNSNLNSRNLFINQNNQNNYNLSKYPNNTISAVARASVSSGSAVSSASIIGTISKNNENNEYRNKFIPQISVSTMNPISLLPQTYNYFNNSIGSNSGSISHNDHLFITDNQNIVVYRKFYKGIPCPPPIHILAPEIQIKQPTTSLYQSQQKHHHIITVRPRIRECLCNPIGSTSHICDRRNGQCICHLNVIGRRCEKCQIGFFNLTGGFGCRDCQCDRIGSINDDCDQWTGQCQCKNGVGGRRCKYCMDGFYGFSKNGCKLCEPCQSPGHICDSVTGRCVCPPNSKGPDCHQCLTGTFGWQPKAGCIKCDCDNGGSIGQSCDFHTGQCACREGYIGRRCDACAIGYFGYPDCRRCHCNIDGSFIRNDGLIECDANGQCPCKELVIGLKCDTCVHSTFGLDRLNPEGCTKCFCFGRSQECQQSVLSWGHIRIPTARNLSVNYVHSASIPTKEYEYIVVVQMEGSNIHREDSKISIMNGLNLIPSSIGNVTIGSYTTFYYPLYFQLPPQFYGDRTNSYGGYLRYQVETDGFTNRLDNQILYNFPLVQIHSHNKLILDYYDTEFRDLSHNETYVIPLHESYWKFHHNRQDITRAVLMTALQNIKHIFLRATSWSDFSNVMVSNVHMDSAIYLLGSTSVLAHGVEKCICPNRYNGLSCQDPGKGYYRFYNSTEIIETVSVYWEDYIGYSVPCNCNSRSEYCDQESGACLHCRDNTGGSNCDRCAEGYFGDPNYGKCQACPCPETSKNFAKGCTVWNKEVSCICKPGYVGTRCEKCRPGYFGNPGDVNGSCEKCKCHVDGSLSNICDEITGQCHCKPDVIGSYCDKCIVERHILESGACKLCDNCSLILIDYIDSIGHKLRRGVAHMDLTGIPAPYLKLEEYDTTINKNIEHFRDYMHTKYEIENQDDNLIEKLFSYSENNMIQSRKLNTTASKRGLASNILFLDSNKIYLEIGKIKDDILKTIFQLSNYSNNDSEITFPIALDQAHNFLNEINYHYDLSNNMRNNWDCAWENLYFYGNASDTVFDQKAQLEMIWRNMNATNYKITDMDQITLNTFDLLNEAGDIQEHVINTEILVREKYAHGKEIETQLTDLLDKQYYSTQIEFLLDIIDNNFSQIKTGLLNLVNLGKFWNNSSVEYDSLRRDLKKHWVPKAWRHANRLSQKSKEYAKMFQPTKDGATVAMLASSAHKNISNAIESAKNASVESKQSVVIALEKLYPQNGVSVVERAQESIEKSKLLQQHALEQMKNLNVLKYNLRIHEDKVDIIKSKIWQAGIESNNISASLSSLNTDNSISLIRDSIHLVSKISDEMRSENRKAVDTKSDIYKLRQKYSALEPDWDIKLGLADENISHTLSNIRLINTSINTAEIYSIREHQKFELWNNTISKQLQELKDKIDKARHAAEGIKISLESLTPKCIRSYMSDNLGLSTSNTIKLSLALRNRIGNSPLIFLEGHDRKYIGLEMFRNKIRLVWNLGGIPTVITHPLEIHSKDPKYDEAWYHIEANRTLNVGTLLVRRMTANGALTNSNPVTGYSDLKHTRLYRTNFNRIYLGGVPHNLKPKEFQASPGLNVVINHVQVDNKLLGIWNFMYTEGNCKGAMIGAQPATASTNVRYFNGFGYSQVQKNRQRPYRKNIFDLQMTFRTMDENALLFLAVDDGNNRTIAVSLSAGKIVFRIDYDEELNLEIKTDNKYNTGKWITVAAAREFSSKGTENGRLKINSEIPILGTVQGLSLSNLIPDLSKGIFYLGGVPPGFTTQFIKASGGRKSFLGCMKDIAINSETYDPLESSSYFGVEETCKEAITISGFNGNGYVELPSQSLRKRSNVAFIFRTVQDDCLLLLSAYPPQIEYNEIRGNYSISVIDGKIHVWINTGKSSLTLVSNNSVNDGEYHALNVIKTGRKIELYIDDQFQISKIFSIVPSLVNMPKDFGGLYIGGAPHYPEFKNLSPTLIGLKGAIRDIIFNNRTISLSETLSFVNADIGRFGPSMGAANSDDIFMKTEPIEKSEEPLSKGCDKVSTYSYEYNAYKFGDNLISYSEIELPNRNFWQRNFLISFDIRTFYPNGILLISPGSKEKPKHYVSLVLKDGHLTLIIRSRKREELTLTAKLNDGEWHHVSVHCHDRKVTMIVEIGGTDQKTSVQMKLPKKIGTSHNIYIGGLTTDNSINLPSELLIRLEGLKGCIRNLQINNKTQYLAQENKHFNVGKCFPKIEKGSHFPGNAFAVYKKNFQVGKFLELELDFRTSELNGILISVSEPAGFPALSLELYKGNIIFSCDLGDGNPIRVESILPSKFFICDNKWHNISALYDYEQIILRIDNHSPAIAFAQHRIAGKVQTKSPLYIGGLPDIAPSGTLLSRDNFKGCIRNISIRNERRDWIDMDGLHNILLSECLAIQ